MDQHDREVLEMMERYGGGFVSALAKAAFRADDENLDRIKSTFPHLWQEYAKFLTPVEK